MEADLRERAALNSQNGKMLQARNAGAIFRRRPLAWHRKPGEYQLRVRRQSLLRKTLAHRDRAKPLPRRMWNDSSLTIEVACLQPGRAVRRVREGRHFS